MEVIVAKCMKLSKLANQVTSVVHRHSIFVGPMKTTLKFAIAFEKEYYEKFVATRIQDTMKVVLGSEVLTEMKIQSYYRHIPVDKMILRHKSLSPPLEILYVYEAGRRCLKVSIWMKLNLTPQPKRSCRFSFELQETVWKTHIEQLFFMLPHFKTPLGCSGRAHFYVSRSSYKLCF